MEYRKDFPVWQKRTERLQNASNGFDDPKTIRDFGDLQRARLEQAKTGDDWLAKGEVVRAPQAHALAPLRARS